jgi:MFS transporter, NNP family, nitrate/nitrite transporter
MGDTAAQEVAPKPAGAARETKPKAGWIDDWRPEDPAFWSATGARVARRNLVFSILAEHTGFSVWLLWSAVAVSLPAAGFRFSVDQLFWLVALPNLVGSVLRVPYTVAVARFGGRNWSVASATALVLPLALLVACVSNPDTPYWMFLVAAGCAGIGGGNFASSMANISYFYPDRSKGTALAINAAGGNIGVAVVQLLVPVVIAVGIFGAPQAPRLYLQNVAWVWLPAVLVAAVCAWLFMDNLAVSRTSIRAQLPVLRSRHTWVVSMLYIGTFGSFIGYSSALPLLARTEFPASPGVRLAFLGPLVGSLARPLGGWLADRYGGARVTGWTFLAMGAGVAGVIAGTQAASFTLFLGAFLVLFVASGVGNGSTYRMIPAICRAEVTDRGWDPGTARQRAAAVIGLCSAIGALGGFFIPRGFGTSVAMTGSADAALLAFLAFYGACLAATWWWYLRRSFATQSFPNLAWADV